MDHLSSTIIMCAILVLFYASGTVKGENIGEACTVDGNCTQTNAVCSSNKCACPTGDFLNTTSNQCVDKVGVNGTCSITETSTGQCSDGNSTCSAGASGHSCFCTSAYYDASNTCTPRKKPDEECTSYQCVANAMCNSTKCACNTGYIATPTSTPTSCESVVAFDADCSSSACTEDKNECSSTTSKCVCTGTSFRDTSTSACVDRKKPDEGCTANQCVANAVCNTTDDKCDCNTGYRATPTSTPTSCEIVAFGADCTIDSDCGEDNNVCSNSTCVCSDTSSRKGNACVISSDAATIMLAHMHVFIFGTVASLYFLL